MANHPVSNKEEVIERLISENRQYLEVINEIKLLLCNEKEFDQFSMLSGVKTLMSRYLELKNKIYSLEERIKKLETK